jgi:ATP/maltotriose-dependent transcriptional regulator MalT/DNA-binding SARP family transcriptional activator
MKEPVRIFLDNLENLIANSPSLHFIRVLLAEAPPQVYFTLMSRTSPPLPLQQMKIRREAHVLTNELLAFNVEETSVLFRNVFDMPLSGNVLNRVHQFTEGWIGGLVLLADVLKGIPVEQHKRYLAEHIPERFKTEIFNYFGEEILSNQPPNVQKVLTQSCIFDLVDPKIAGECISVQGVDDIIEDISRTSQFVETVYDPNGQWGLRYHNLFRGFLKERLLSGMDKSQLRVLYEKAAHLYQQHGQIETAVKFYLEAGAYPKAVSALRQVAIPMLMIGRYNDLARCLEKLPKKMVQEDPWLLYYLSMTVRFIEITENAKRLSKAYYLFEAKGELSGQLLALAMLIEASILGGQDLIPMAQLLEQAENLIKSDTSDQFLLEKAMLWLQMGFGYTLRGGQPRKGNWACQNAYLIARRLKALPLQANALINALLSKTFGGDFADADKTARKIENLLKKEDFPELRVLYYINLFQFYNFNGEFKKARDLIETAQQEAQQLGLLYLYPAIQLQLLCLLPQMDAFNEAEEIGESLVAMATSLGHLFYQGLAMLFLGISHYRKCDFEKAREFVLKSKKIFLSKEANSPTQLYLSNLVMGLIYTNQGKYRLAETELNRFLEIEKTLNNPISDIHYCLATSLLKHREGRLDTAADHLFKGFEIAHKEGIDHVIWLSSTDMMQACILALEFTEGTAFDHAAHILVARFGSNAIDELARLEQRATKKVKAQALSIEAAIDRSSAPRVTIHTLGAFEVYIGDEPLHEAGWQRHQAQTLLKAIVARGSRRIPRDLLMEDLWPENDAKTAEQNFKVTLHRLRKSLHAEMDKRIGSLYVHLKHNLVSLDEELCDVDADRFQSLVEQGSYYFKKGVWKKAEALLKSAVELYKGDFLPQDLYDDWALLTREKLLRRNVESLFMLAKASEERGALKKAQTYYRRAIDTDPFLEEAYQCLMVLLSKQDKINQAVQIYLECKSKMEKELDTAPDPNTEALYRQILDRTPNK